MNKHQLRVKYYEKLQKHQVDSEKEYARKEGKEEDFRHVIQFDQEGNLRCKKQRKELDDLFGDIKT